MATAPPPGDWEAHRAPWWIRPARALIRHLPTGRFRAAAGLSRLAPVPFVADLASELGGARFWCDLGDDIARDACLGGAYEPQVSGVLARLLGPGMTFVDVGANWGYFALLAAASVTRAGTVIALEPDPRMFSLLERNFDLNAFGHARGLQVAAGASSGVLVLDGFVDGAGNRGVSRITDRGAPTGGRAIEVPSVRLDKLLASRGTTKVDVIKIDVEGFEHAVLSGMREGLAAHRFTRVLIELHPGILAERGLTPDACCALLLDAGYRGWTFDHTAAARRRAAYAAPGALDEVLTRSDRVAPGDSWPHMLWTAPGAEPL